jgi:hypothetical protein
MEVFIEYLYLSGNTDKAHEIFYNSIEEYQDRLTRISEISPEQQAEYQNGILNDLEEYRMLVALPLIYKDSILFKKESSVFNDYVNKFRHLMVADAAEDSVPVAE